MYLSSTYTHIESAVHVYVLPVECVLCARVSSCQKSQEIDYIYFGWQQRYTHAGI